MTEQGHQHRERKLSCENGLCLHSIVAGRRGVCALAFSVRTRAPTVVVYVSHDQVFSEPILKDFEKETGIKVRAVYDTEETKSTGTMNRLIAEKNNPQADVYWANEPVRAEVLRQQGIAAPYLSPNAEGISASFKDPDGYWTGFAARARVLIVNKKQRAKPDSVLAYADPQWRGQDGRGQSAVRYDDDRNCRAVRSLGR